ncbi:MAG: DUF5320 domain-containing protein [Candidatus Omnitrophica bacterium]|nr:DUF5320 domain-containing protein [Candidatus Omnitrophota bacterium]
MPGGDRTGPSGMGPRTGRAEGYCEGTGMPGFANLARGGRNYGFGRGGGRGGRGWRHWFRATGLSGWQRAAQGGALPKEQELAGLREQARQLEGTLAGIRKRIEELNAQ